MKRVLFITYYWPPSGKPSIHWPLFVIKHIGKSGWQPVVLTVEEDTFNEQDRSMLKEVPGDVAVYKAKAFEPFNLYRALIGKKQDEPLVASETISSANKGLAHRLSVWIRMNLFVPDARIGWYPSAVKKGKEIYLEEKFDAVVSIGPPHSVHLIAKTLSQTFNLPHVPVFIDPWTDIAYYRGFSRSRLTLRLDNYFEKSVLQNCANAVFVTRAMEQDYNRKYPFLGEKAKVLYWGYNEENFIDAEIKKPEREKIMLHAGNIFDYQNPENLWREIRKRNENGGQIKIKFIGTVSPGIRASLAANGLDAVTEYKGFLPYNEAITEMLSASYLLVCATESRHLPGKLFEYLRTGVPILAYGDDNDEAASMLREANAGMLLRYKDDPAVFFETAHSFKADNSAVKQYDRAQIAEKLGNILDNAFN